ncbi:MAG TPA: substrate-binding domain-containing protein [Marisediminicola sp.]|jgi:ribose transport system substrate-binding protein|nr:substrate-binding domain-containing protein [Marisediminicola sp.]
MAKKRLALVPFACALMVTAATLSGCGNASGNGGNEQPLIGMSVRYIAGNSWLTTLANAAGPAGKNQGYNVETVDAQGSATRQIQQMQTFINKGAKAIVIEPVEDRGVAAGIAAAKKAGVPVVVVNDRVAPDLAKSVACNVYDDGAATAKKVGEQTAQAVAARHPSGSTVKLYIQALFPQELVTQTREDGFMAGWNEYFAAHPGITTVRVPNNYGQALPDKTLSAMRNVLAGNPDIDVIFNQTDVVMPAVKEALKGAGLIKDDGSSKVIVAGFDGGMDVVKEMATNPNSPVVVDGLNQPPTQAAYAVEEAIAADKGQKTGKCDGSPATRVLPALVATPETAKDFVNPDLQFAGSK